MKGRIIWLIIFMTGSFLSLIGQTEQRLIKDDWERYKLRGAVSTVIDSTWVYNPSGERVKGNYPYPPSAVREVFEFDEVGMLTSMFSQRQNGASYTDSLLYGNGLLVKLIRYVIKEETSRLELIIKYDGLSRRVTEYFGNKKIIYHYEGGDKLPSVIDDYRTNNGVEKLFLSKAYTYDSRGNIIKVQIKSGATSKQISEISYEYDDQGNRVLCLNDKAEGIFDSEERWRYNANGHIIEKIHQENGRTNRMVYEYQYDPSGNWVERVARKTNGYHTITKRRITYYE